MSMFSPKPIMKDLAVLFPLVYGAMDYAIAQTKDFFENQENAQDRIIDPYLAPNQVRFHAVKYLKRAGQDVQEDNDLSIANIPNNGMHINFGRYQIKILKSSRGDLPVPGHSRIRQGYYSQDNLFNDDDPNMTINLLILWNAQIDFNGLGVLSLACPKAGGVTRESVAHHFHCEIPQKLLYGVYNVSDEIQDSEIYDLPLKLDIEETGTDDK